MGDDHALRRLNKMKLIIIGSGVIGAWAAMKLAGHGEDILVIDSYGPGNVMGSSHDSNRVIRSFYGGNTTLTSMVARSLTDWKELEFLTSEKLYTRTGVLWMIQNEDSHEYAQRSLEVSQACGLPCQRIEVDEAAQFYPQINFSDIRSVYREEEAGYVQATKSIQLLSDVAQNLGARYLCDKVVDIHFRNKSLTGVSLASGDKINGDEFILCAGPWINELSRKIFSEDWVQVSKQEVYYFRHPLPDTRFQDPGLPVWIDMGQSIHYGVPATPNVGFKVCNDNRGETICPDSMDRLTSSESLKLIREFVNHRFPGMKDPALIQTKVCQYSNTSRGNYIIDFFPGVQNGVVLAGGNGHGFKNAPAIAQLGIDILKGQANPIPQFQISPRPGGRITPLENDCKI